MGVCLTLVIVLQIPIWAIYAIYRNNKGQTLKERIDLAMIDNDEWGPKDKTLKNDWRSKYANYKISGVKSQPGLTEADTLKKYETIDSKHISADNPAFVADIP